MLPRDLFQRASSRGSVRNILRLNPSGNQSNTGLSTTMPTKCRPPILVPPNSHNIPILTRPCKALDLIQAILAAKDTGSDEVPRPIPTQRLIRTQCQGNRCLELIPNKRKLFNVGILVPMLRATHLSTDISLSPLACRINTRAVLQRPRRRQGVRTTRRPYRLHRNLKAAPDTIKIPLRPMPINTQPNSNLANTPLGTAWDLELQHRTLNLSVVPGHLPHLPTLDLTLGPMISICVDSPIGRTYSTVNDLNDLVE